MRKFTSLLLLGFALGSFAQTPGGVSGSELWFKTAPLNSDLQGYYRWQDFSGDSIRLMLLDSRGVKSELTLPNSSVHYFNFNPSLWLADGFRSLSAKLKHGNLSQATVIGVFAPELATIGKDMVVYALDGRKGDGAILSKDKAVRGRGVEPLDYGSASGEDLLYQSSDSLSENGFKESALRVVSYFKVSNPSTTLWGDNSNTTLFIGTPSTSGSFGTDFPTSLFGNASIRGYAPELIVFSRMLTEAFNLVSHSMGGAFSKGIEKYLKEMGRKVEYNLMINTYQVDRIHNPKSNETFYIDYQNTNDPVLFWFDINLGYGSLKNSDVKIREKSGDVGILYIHRFPIDSDSKFWEKIQSHLPSNQ